MFPKMNPKQMKKMMRQMGMEMKELSTKEVIIRIEDGSEITISGPSVNVIEMQGQKTYQISGGSESAGSSSNEGVSDDDVALIASQAGVSKEAAEEALKKSEGDIAAAIMSLSK
jgi:nascent polypeptide-associated complex subunit alpha